MMRMMWDAMRLTVAVLCLALCGAAEPPTQPARPASPVTACAFSPDGSAVYAAAHDAILILASRDGTVQATLKPGLQRVTSLALSPNGQLLAVAGGVPGISGTVVLINRKSGQTLVSVGGYEDLATSVVFSPDGNMIAAASADRSARLFEFRDDPVRLAPVARLEGHAGPVLSVLFSRDSATVVTGSTDRSIKVWDAAGGKLRRTLTNHTGAVYCLAGRPLPQGGADAAPFACASGGDDRTLRIWQPEIGRMVRIVRGHEGPIFGLAYATDGTALFSAGAEGIVRMIDANSDTVLQQWRAAEDWIYALSVSPDGKTLATGDWTGSVKLWRLDKESPRLVWSASVFQSLK